MKIHSVFVLLACLGLVTSQASYYCGRRLATALDAACDGHLIKRSERQQDVFKQPNYWPWIIDESSARGLASRAKRGVVDECCLKPCTVEELRTYCH